MNSYVSLGPVSRITFVTLLALMGFYAIVVFIWQIRVIRGHAMRNPDGTVDDWREQKILFGMAVADVFWACPAILAGVVLAALGSIWGTLLLAYADFWFIWANIMTTVTSLRFENPRITLSWIVAFPAGVLVGAGYLAWFVIHGGWVLGVAGAGL